RGIVGPQRRPLPEPSQLGRRWQTQRQRELCTSGGIPTWRRHAELPQRDPPIAFDQGIARPGPCQQLERARPRAGSRGKIGEAPKAAASLACGDELLDVLLADAADIAEDDADDAVAQTALDLAL